ncbi:MAG: glycosyltransferase family 2 protein [Patescibacteria group bacterium]|nr:glycosyltransferase family 2 protein [Patescibacteria group bacterium]
MDKQTAKIYIGFITYGKSTAKYLPYFLPSLKAQSFKDFKILAVDNSETEENENAEYIRKNFPEIAFKWPGKNLGFAKAFNLMINEAIKAGAEYFLVLNPDMELLPDVIEKLFKIMEGEPALGAVAPKTLKWDFNNNIKTDIIDTLGIKLLPGLRFTDLGQNSISQRENKQLDILGPSGNIGLFRVSALEKIKRAEQYFDELMFMYKEDCDLAYRLFLTDFKAKCVSNAVVYHHRTVKGMGEKNLEVALNRKNKSRQAKKWSFLNQQIIFIKYWRLQSPLNKMAIVWFEFKMLIFALLFEPYLFKEFNNLSNIRHKILRYKKWELN